MIHKNSNPAVDVGISNCFGVIKFVGFADANKIVDVEFSKLFKVGRRPFANFFQFKHILKIN